MYASVVKTFFLQWKVYVDGGGDTEMGEFVQCSEYTILKLKITRFLFACFFPHFIFKDLVFVFELGNTDW